MKPLSLLLCLLIVGCQKYSVDQVQRLKTVAESRGYWWKISSTWHKSHGFPEPSFMVYCASADVPNGPYDYHIDCESDEQSAARSVADDLENPSATTIIMESKP